MITQKVGIGCYAVNLNHDLRLKLAILKYLLTNYFICFMYIHFWKKDLQFKFYLF